MAIFQSFDPTSMSKDDLRKIFVAREKLLKYALRRIEESGAGKPKKHLLLVGPRGSGKTHFQLLVYYEVKEKLSKQWLVLKFPEEEYSITSLADLLLSILQKMGQEGIYEAEKLREKLCICDDDVIEEDAISFIKKFHAETEKNILLLLENFQDLAVQLDTKGVHKLKAFIQENDFLMLFPSSLSTFRQVVNYGEPFYDFFEYIQLKKLRRKDTEELLIKLAEWENRSDFVNTLKKKNERIKGIYNLTGGSVRLIVLIYHIISHDPLDDSHKALEEVETALHNLLNELTPYYQYQMNVLSIQQRKILDNMALYEEGAIQPKELAKCTRIDPRVVSHQLKLLKDLGYVKSHKKGRIAKYEVAERLFRIWRETRIQKGKKARINFLTQFFKYYYKPLELWDMYKLWKTKHQSALDSGRIGTDQKTTQTYYDYLSAIVDSEEFKDLLVKDRFEKADKLLQQGKMNELILETEGIIDVDNKNGGAWCLKGFALLYLSRFEEALSAFDKVIELNPKHPSAWGGKGLVLGTLSRYEEALSAFNQFLELNPKDDFIWSNKGITLGQLGRNKEALSAFDKAIELNPKIVLAWGNKGVALLNLGYTEDALIAFEKVLELNPKDELAWEKKGEILINLERYKEALIAFDKALQLNPKDASTCVNKGLALESLNRHNEALDMFEQAIQLEPKLIIAWGGKGVVLGNLGRYEEALAAFKQSIKIEPELSIGWFSIAQTLLNLGRYEESFFAFNKSIDLNYEYSGVAINLLWLSFNSAEEENLGIAVRAFNRAIELIEELSKKEQESKEEQEKEELIIEYFKWLFEKPKVEFIEKTLNKTLSIFPQMDLLLKPYFRALEYLKNKDDDLLKNLHPEERAVVKDILGIEDEEKD